MYDKLFSALKHIRGGGTDTQGRHIIPAIVIGLCAGQETSRILDVGAGFGDDLGAIKSAIPSAIMSAVEGYPRAIEHLRKSGVNVASIDLERDRLPFADDTFDVVMCNQVIEHTKEIFWIVSELARVCKLGGHLLIGVPNLGSLHNRVALLLGHQPPAMHVFGPHIRGFTNHGLKEFLEAAGTLRVERIVGGNFHPFPHSISRPLARWLPGLAVSTFMTVRKISPASYLDVLDTPRGAELSDTPFYRGPDVVHS